ncbi:uncharacterized protein CIMG_03070 [Coccidioides immitis RS]|uniref:Uncharacterized protein n=3 Tax=Coccidioides immitis TaxID=5501 RepID=J3KAJ4_COCIM|nr:uncharacterized protein CIMG_03070 [Coccidioides immitis RS]EAS32046.3 hypothetical protein CIMG_03070 [Coccidioides immitis RS]KMP07234.1 hypothetical protein CIRG_06915 [Coccidioides immitis RMSCC 2394]KMU82308.1 hypothetical protein CIHG_00092 [Coccidioides immitis H538.4]
MTARDHAAKPPIKVPSSREKPMRPRDAPRGPSEARGECLLVTRSGPSVVGEGSTIIRILCHEIPPPQEEGSGTNPGYIGISNVIFGLVACQPSRVPNTYSDLKLFREYAKREKVENRQGAVKGYDKRRLKNKRGCGNNDKSRDVDV